MEAKTFDVTFPKACRGAGVKYRIVAINVYDAIQGAHIAAIRDGHEDEGFDDCSVREVEQPKPALKKFSVQVFGIQNAYAHILKHEFSEFESYAACRAEYMKRGFKPTQLHIVEVTQDASQEISE